MNVQLAQEPRLVADAVDAPSIPTVWGLTPLELHDRFWAARGVQVVRPGETSPIVAGAELFMLLAPKLMTIFRMRGLLDPMYWLAPRVLYVRLRDDQDHGYRERVVTDDGGRFVRIERQYRGSDTRLTRVALTADVQLARMWRCQPDARSAWTTLRQAVPRQRRATASVAGRAYSRSCDDDLMRFVRELAQVWKRPDATIARVKRVGRGVWVDQQSAAQDEQRFVGPVWVGAGRSLPDGAMAVGPAVMWDDPSHRPAPRQVDWHELEPSVGISRRVPPPRPRTTAQEFVKRGLDVVVALLALVGALPLFPLIMLAIWVEDRAPLFFVHRRESRGGREFGCLKFRTMYRNADQIKQDLTQQNQVDGPQFYIEDDPRVTKVGRFLRNTYLDELPQLFNVLAGHMSIVGPRPSPYKENQCCPSWREARLSVRPGITGLWQVMRTRQRGLDFQEWIRYDLEYIDRQSLRLDLWIIGKTAGRLARRLLPVRQK
jgi:lipopolysaccharide/colanic/teichoic acid biosynthesis glycosyltransferase